MNILTIRTDKPEAEIGLFKGETKIEYFTWEAHRILAETLHIKIRELLERHKLNLHEIEAVIVFTGPGSFTGLRIGVAVANALSDSMHVPIVGCGTDKWISVGLNRVLASENDKIVSPEYGALPNITAQKK